MSNWDLGVVTDAGVTLLNKLEAGVATATIDTIAIGNGVYSSTEKATIARRTALKSQKMTAAIASRRFPDDRTLEVKTSLDNITVSTGFYITECGVFATVTEGGETSTILFAIAYTETPDYMSPYNGSYPQTQIEDFYFPISNTDALTVTITPGAYVLAEDLGLATEPEVRNMADELMGESPSPGPSPEDEIATDEEVEEAIENLDDL